MKIKKHLARNPQTDSGELEERNIFSPKSLLLFLFTNAESTVEELGVRERRVPRNRNLGHRERFRRMLCISRRPFDRNAARNRPFSIRTYNGTHVRVLRARDRRNLLRTPVEFRGKGLAVFSNRLRPGPTDCAKRVSQLMAVGGQNGNVLARSDNDGPNRTRRPTGKRSVFIIFFYFRRNKSRHKSGSPEGRPRDARESIIIIRVRPHAPPEPDRDFSKNTASLRLLPRLDDVPARLFFWENKRTVTATATPEHTRTDIKPSVTGRRIRPS